MLARGATMLHSAVNQLSALRLKVASNFDEFLHYARATGSRSSAT